MSNQAPGQRDWLAVARDAVATAIFPQQCFACGAASGSDVLCSVCLAELPGKGDARCPVCAIGQPLGEICGACLREAPPFDATWAVLDYGFPVDRLIQALKYGHRLSTSRLFVDLMAAVPVPEADIVLPMPLHPARLRERGFNQAAELARSLAQRWGLPVLLDGVVRDFDTTPQASLPWKARVANIRGAFRVTAPLAGKRVVVIDDVMTTGATLTEFARALKAAGAERVENRVVARTPAPA